MSVHLGEIDFYWKVSSSQFDELPAQLPFVFDRDSSRPYLLRQMLSEDLLATLHRMYTLESNVGYLQDSNPLGRAYGQDLKRFIDELRKNEHGGAFSQLGKPKILEIGCGGATVLKTLAVEDCDAWAIDPSPIATASLLGTNVKLVSDFFPNQIEGERFDLIFSADVLEHIEDPVSFLNQNLELLVDGGVVLVSTPDCTQSIELGDVSMALHQHLTYFSETSLLQTLKDSGLADVKVERSRYGGSLYGVGYKAKVTTNFGRTLGAGYDEVTKFLIRAPQAVARVQDFLVSAFEDKESVGAYVPLRVLPYLGSCETLSESVASLRLFDDTPLWRTKRLQGRLSPIENFDDLESHPVIHLFLMSLTFGEQLSAKIQFNKILASNAKLVTLEEMLGLGS